MKKNLIIFAILALALVSGFAARADDIGPPDFANGTTSDDYLFTSDELDEMLAPIALYPDPLIAQILPAATFIDQIDEAARYIRQFGNSARIDDKPWDVSVRAIAHYPDVLFMMDQKYDWTASLGQAFINQQQDVMDSIQRLRAAARAAGALESTPQQQVVIEDSAIMIVPAEPEVIYVPQYDPQVVVEGIYPSYGFIDFGIGFTIGAWLNRDCDWRRHRVYYHGWRGGGWVGRTRPHIHVRNNVYINNNFNVINTNRRVIRHDTNRYREDLRHNAQIHRGAASGTPKGRDTKPRDRIENLNIPQNRIAPDSHLQQRPAAGATQLPARPPIIGTKEVQPPDKKDIYRGRELGSGQTPAPFTGYGGYGSSKDAASFRERGQNSRETMRQLNGPRSTSSAVRAPVRAPAPVMRPDSGAGRQAAPPAERNAPRTAAPARRGGVEPR